MYLLIYILCIVKAYSFTAIRSNGDQIIIFEISRNNSQFYIQDV